MAAGRPWGTGAVAPAAHAAAAYPDLFNKVRQPPAAGLRVAQGAWDDALAYYEEAHATYAATGHVYEAGRCLAALACVRERRGAPGDPEAAHAAGAAARRLFGQLGAPLR